MFFSLHCKFVHQINVCFGSVCVPLYLVPFCFILKFVNFYGPGKERMRVETVASAADTHLGSMHIEMQRESAKNRGQLTC